MKYLYFIFILFTSCKLLQDNEYHKLPEKYRTTLKQNDTLIYMSDIDLDTLVVGKIANATYQFALSGNSGKEPYEYWEIELLYFFKNSIPTGFKSVQNDTKYGENEGFLLPNFSQAFQIHYGIKGDYQPIVKFNDTYYKCTDTISSMISHTEYKNVYLYKPQKETKEYSEIYMNYQKGILKYVSNDHIYELVMSY